MRVLICSVFFLFSLTTSTSGTDGAPDASELRRSLDLLAVKSADWTGKTALDVVEVLGEPNKRKQLGTSKGERLTYEAPIFGGLQMASAVELPRAEALGGSPIVDPNEATPPGSLNDPLNLSIPATAGRTVIGRAKAVFIIDAEGLVSDANVQQKLKRRYRGQVGREKR